MPGKRKGRVPSLDPETRRRIEDVHAGRSTMLWLAGGGSDDLMEVLEAIRDLTALRSLSLRDTRIERLPPWLDELPNLEEIDLSGAEISTLPSQRTERALAIL